MAGLNPKQLKFVELYQQSLAAGKPNATQAYSDAYGVKDARIAKAAASRLLTNVNVQQLLKPAKQEAEVVRVEQVTGIVINRERIRLEMARLAFVNPKSFYRPDGTAKDIPELDDDTAAALASFEVEEEFAPGSDGQTVVKVTRTKKFKLWDKNRALISLADTEPGVWVDKDSPPQNGDVTNNTQVNVNVVNTSPLPDADAVLGFLRDLGLPCPANVPGDGHTEPLDRRVGA